MALPQPQHPIHRTKLPSTKKEISFRPYLVKEEKLLLIASQSDDGGEMMRATKQVLDNCILEENFNVDDMTIFDMQYMFVQLRAKSVSEIVDLTVVCKHCEHPNDYKLNIGAINIDIPEDLNFKIQLGSGVGITMRFPKVEILDKFIDKDMTSPENSILMIVSCIENIFDETTVYDPRSETIEEQIAWVESLSMKDMKKIEEFTNKIPSLEEKISFECASCNKTNTRDIGGMNDFF